MMSQRSNKSKFEKIINNSPCPFALKANVAYGSPLKNYRNGLNSIRLTASELVRFVRKFELQKLDGFVIEFSEKDNPENLEELSKQLKNILSDLNKNDPNRSDCMNLDISDSSWQFRFGGLNFFINTFASFYLPSHPRYSMSEDSSFIFFQPLDTFDWHIPTDEPKQISAIKQNIRDRFEKAGKSYDKSIVSGTSEALKYIKPLNIGDEAIKWWI